METHHFDYAGRTYGIRAYNKNANRLEVYRWKPEDIPKKCRADNLIAEYFGNTRHFEFHNEPNLVVLNEILKHMARGSLGGKRYVSGCGQRLASELSDIVAQEIELRQKVELNHQQKNGQRQEPIWTQ